MIEKSYEKEISLTASKSAITRVANRFVKEWCEANETATPREEILAVAEKIKNFQEIEDVDIHNKWESDSGWFYGRRDYDKAVCTYEEQYYATMCWSDDAYFVRWYFFASRTYSKKIGDKTYTAKSLEEITKLNYEHRGKYRYFCTHRPPSKGAIPEGYVWYEQYKQGSEHLGEVTYDEKPSDNDCWMWGLVEDKDYERVRKCWLETEEE